MDLRAYLNTYPRRQRAQIRRLLAAAHGLSEVTVRAWANGQRRHPCGIAAIEITETMTGGRVTRHDLRPDVFGNTTDSHRGHRDHRERE